MGIPTELHLETSKKAWSKIRDRLPRAEFYEEGIFDCSKAGVISFDELSFEQVLDFALSILCEAQHLSCARKSGPAHHLRGNGGQWSGERHLSAGTAENSPPMIPAFAISITLNPSLKSPMRGHARWSLRYALT